MGSSLDLWTVYERPTDYPDGFIARRWTAGERAVPTEDIITGPTLDDVRAGLPSGLTCLVREPADDPCIVETWL